MAMKGRSRFVGIKVPAELLERADAVASKLKVTRSDLFRFCIWDSLSEMEKSQ